MNRLRLWIRSPNIRFIRITSSFLKINYLFLYIHRLSSTRFCDRIIYIKNGDITEVGTHEELMAEQKDYFKLYEAQAYYYKHDKEEKEEKT